MNEKHLRRKVVDKDGNPIINRFGHAISDELTANEIAYVESELAKGTKLKPLSREMECPVSRIMQIRDNKDAHDRIMEYQKSVVIPQQLNAITELLLKQSDLIDDLVQAQTKLVAEQGRVRKALLLKQIGESRMRIDVRNLKAERDQLRKMLHKKTGIDVGPYKRDG